MSSGYTQKRSFIHHSQEEIRAHYFLLSIAQSCCRCSIQQNEHPLDVCFWENIFLPNTILLNWRIRILTSSYDFARWICVHATALISVNTTFVSEFNVSYLKWTCMWRTQISAGQKSRLPHLPCLRLLNLELLEVTFFSSWSKWIGS